MRTPDLGLATALSAEQGERESAPYRYFRCRSWAQERYLREMLVNGLDTYWHSGNGGGKTAGGVFADAAALLGIESVRPYFRECPKCGKKCDPHPEREPINCGKCSIPHREAAPILLPRIEPPITWGLGVPSYKIAAGSSLPMLRALLGKHPYLEVRQGNRSTVTQIFVRHLRSKTGSLPGAATIEPGEDWSQLFVFPYDGEWPEGVRLDGWHCDEPPPDGFIDALRSRGKAGRHLYQGITATPLDELIWRPILEQYPPELLKESGGRIRIQSSVYDNSALGRLDLERIERSFLHRPERVRKARMMGEHVNFKGSCPFDDAILDEMEAACVEPKRETLMVQREVDGHASRRLQNVSCELEIFGVFEEGDVCFATADTGKGIKDGKHDPDCFHVYSRRKRTLLLRCNEYLGGFGLGQAMAIVAKRYGNCEVDPAVTGGYGEAVLSGLRQGGHTNIARAHSLVNPGHYAKSLGFYESRESNAAWFGAAEAALGSRAVTVRSHAVVNCLRDLIKDERGKILAGPGYHDEDWVCFGRAVYKLGLDPHQRRADAQTPRTVGDLFRSLMAPAQGFGAPSERGW